MPPFFVHVHIYIYIDIPDVSLTGPVKGITDTCNRNKGIVSSNMKAPDCLLAQCKKGSCEDAEECDQLSDMSLPNVWQRMARSHTPQLEQGGEGG